MNNILNSVSQATSVSSNDSVAIVHNNKLYQVSQLKIGDQVSIKDVKTSGIYIGYIEIDGIKTELYANGGNFDDLDIQFSPESYDYDGMPIEVTNLVVKKGTETLVKDEDYVVSYTNNTNAGTAQVIISAKEGNTKDYSGNKSKDFTINKINMTGVNGSDSTAYSDVGGRISVTGQPAGSTTYYKVVGGSWQTINPTITAIGTTYVYWKVTNPNYNDKTGNNSVTIESRYQTLIDLDNENDCYKGKEIYKTDSCTVPSAGTISVTGHGGCLSGYCNGTVKIYLNNVLKGTGYGYTESSGSYNKLQAFTIPTFDASKNDTIKWIATTGDDSVGRIGFKIVLSKS